MLKKLVSSSYGQFFFCPEVVVDLEKFRGETKYFTFENSTTDVTSIALSFYSGLFAYNGWNYLNFIIEELKDPIVNLPRAIYISCTLVTVVYVLTNVAFYTTLSPAEVLNSEAVAVTFANRIFGPIAWTLPVFVALSTFGGVNGIILTTSRLFYAGACEGQMPEILTMIQVTKMTPTPAVLTIAFLSLLYLMSSNIFALINYVGFATWPDLPRPIKVHLIFPAAYLIASVFVTLVPMMASPVETGIGCLMIATSVPVYMVFIAWRNKPKVFTKSVDASTRFLQKILMVVGKSKSPDKV
ncbi:hypothetical protein M8J75_010383 [Diaphorina citri]|nr:hypothetical protein M8J75_010383 [Diaphorina citri]